MGRWALAKELLWRSGAGAAGLVYAVIQLIFNAVNWMPLEPQEKSAVIRLLRDRRIAVTVTTLVTLLFIALVFRNACRIIRKLDSELSDERAKNTSPEIHGNIEACRLEPLMITRDRDSTGWANLNVLTRISFVNVRPVPAPIKDFTLFLRIDGRMVEAVLTDDPLSPTLRDTVGEMKNLADCRGVSAKQSRPFDGYLYFFVSTGGFLDSSTEISLEKVAIRDFFGGTHNLKAVDPHRMTVAACVLNNREGWNYLEATAMIRQFWNETEGAQAVQGDDPENTAHGQ
jgi:hypothetical protein